MGMCIGATALCCAAQHREARTADDRLQRRPPFPQAPVADVAHHGHATIGAVFLQVMHGLEWRCLA